MGSRTQNLEEKFEDLRSDMFVQTTNVGKLAHIQLKDRERDLQLGAERDSLIRYRGLDQRGEAGAHSAQGQGEGPTAGG